MSILDSSIAPFLFLLSFVTVLAGFFRSLLFKLLALLLLEVVFFVLFPHVLVLFANLVGSIRNLVLG